MDKDQQIQQDYYARHAAAYDDFHLHDEAEGDHQCSLFFLSSMITLHRIKSILDVGSGTGRVIAFLKKVHPDVKVIGVEPVKELRDQGHQKGISKDELMEGDGNKLAFADGSFDLVTEFGILHHVRYPEQVVSEMLRVSKKAIFISDSNNFGQGSRTGRMIKQVINALGLWSTYNFIRTKGKRYQISEGDGLFYSYSVFNNYGQIKKSCKRIHLLNTTDGSVNPYRSASHIALLGIK
jgi:ubiquinone/menaquinone biosynthesis C-methylase UbiE